MDCLYLFGGHACIVSGREIQKAAYQGICLFHCEEKKMTTLKNVSRMYPKASCKWTALFALILLFALSPVSSSAYDIFIGTGEKGSFSHFTGRLIARVIGMHAQKIQCKIIPATGDMHNLTNIKEGSLDIAIVGSGMLYDAIKKKGNFAFLDIDYDNLRILTALYDVPITLVVREDAGISSLVDLLGKRINTGAPRSMQQLAFATIFKAKKWSRNDFSMVAEISTSQSQDTMAFCHGKVQAMVHIGVHPDPALQQLFQLCNAHLVDMDDGDIDSLITENPAYKKISLAAETYPLRPKAVTTFGTRALLVASQDLDEDTVYMILTALSDDQKRLKNAHPTLSVFSLDSTTREDTYVPLHPGAAKFLSEH
jgi:TRAP transporter TAXI family solute receptor